VFEWRASNTLPEPPPIEGGELHVLTPEQTEAGDVLAGKYAGDAKSFLRRGDRGHVATVGGRFAGWMWLSRVSHRDPWSGLRFRLAPDEAYVYAMWVEPEFRPLGVGAMLMATQLSEVQRAGDVSRVYGWVDSNNREMQLLTRMVFGFVQVQTVRRARLLHLTGVQVPRSDEPRFGPVSRAGRHSRAPAR
jgi:GNAT superfamily N-acetyltransferase